jgi:hypothetical protein
MFVSDLRQVGGFLRVFSINKTDFHGITKILLKVALNTTNQQLKTMSWDGGHLGFLNDTKKSLERTLLESFMTY